MRRYRRFATVTSIMVLACISLMVAALGHFAVIIANNPSAGYGHVGNSPYQIDSTASWSGNEPTPKAQSNMSIYSSTNGAAWMSQGTNTNWTYTTWNVYNGCSSCSVNWESDAWAYYPNMQAFVRSVSGVLGPYDTP